MKYRNNNLIMNRKIDVMEKLIFVIFLMLFIYILNLVVFKKEYYTELLEKKTNGTYTISSAPRGRIYDRNYNLLVDNKEVMVIYYKKDKKKSVSEEIKLARNVADNIKMDYSNINDKIIKDFWIAENMTSSNKLITAKEWKKYENRQMSDVDIYKLKLERISEEDLKKYTKKDYESAYIYFLMNNGYSYEEKLIKTKDVTDYEASYIAEYACELDGFGIKYDWERVYLYGDTFKSVLGTVSSIPKEEKDYYLANGYELNDKVGVSYIEKQYEDILRGEKTTYKLVNNALVVDQIGTKGKDIVLSIDIKLQEEIDKILVEQIKIAKNDAATEYFDRAYVVIQNPNNGEVLAMSGKRVTKKNGKYEDTDIIAGIITSPITPGSVVKGASMLTGYNEGVTKVGEVKVDECIKIYSKPAKCSWRTLGVIDDVSALSLSSNVYQFKTAMKVAGFKYSYNKKFTDVGEAFEKYRNVFNQFGLGVKTEIDLPIESIGNVGKSGAADLLLNFVIGQYDTYTPMQLSQYITTIASNGIRYKPHLLRAVHESSDSIKIGELLYEVEPTVLNKLDTKKEYLKRVQKGFIEVMSTGLGRNFMGSVKKPAGKTGTSESFLDSNDDGIIDTPTLSNAFVGYYPYNKPKMTITAVYPNIVNSNSKSSSRSYANIRITRMIAEKFSELYD